MEEEIQLDKQDLKALSSSVRLKILESIRHKPKTPSDIATELGKSAPTVIEHLNMLSLSGFVIKQSASDRKYVFYALSNKGKDVTDSSKKIRLLLYASLVIIVLGAFSNGFYYYSSQVAVPMAAAISGASASGAPPAHINYVYIFILVTGALVLFVYLAVMSRFRERFFSASENV